MADAALVSPPCPAAEEPRDGQRVVLQDSVSPADAAVRRRPFEPPSEEVAERPVPPDEQQAEQDAQASEPVEARQEWPRSAASWAFRPIPAEAAVEVQIRFVPALEQERSVQASPESRCRE